MWPRESTRCFVASGIQHADQTNQRIFGYLDAQQASGKPFYLWIHYVDNHTPYSSPKQYRDIYYPTDRNPRDLKWKSLEKFLATVPQANPRESTHQPLVEGITDINYIIARNKGSVSWLDENVGKLIERLKLDNLWDDTLFVFTSDHGESLGEHGIWFAHGGIFEQTARVPLMIRVPGGPKGIISDALVQLTDVMPTILRRLGLPVPKQARDSISGERWMEHFQKDRALLIEHAGRYLAGVVTEDGKYIRTCATEKITSVPAKKGMEELYDLRNDPGEKVNLVSTRTELMASMRKLLDRLQQDGSHMRTEKVPVNDQTKECSVLWGIPIS